jgi:hypothetical protein
VFDIHGHTGTITDDCDLSIVLTGLLAQAICEVLGYCIAHPGLSSVVDARIAPDVP